MTTTLKIALAALTAATLGNGPEPQADDQSAPKIRLASTRTLAPQESRRTLTLTLQNAKVEAVAQALIRQGVNFVMEPSLVKRQVTVNFVNVPIDEAMSALGTALGGSFRRNGDTYAFTTGPAVRALAVTPFDRDFERDLKKTLELDFAEIERKIQRGQSAEARAKHMAEIEVRLKEQLKDMPRVKIEVPAVPRPPMPPSVKVPVAPEAPRVTLQGRNLDVKGLFDSITPEQWAKHEKQGFLTPDDLTEAQRKKMGAFDSGNWSISLVLGSKRLNLKGSN